MAGLSGFSGAGFTPSREAPPAREASLSGAIGQFDPIIKAAEQTRDQLVGLLDRVFGPHPTPVNEESKEPPAVSMIGTLNMRARALSRLLDEIADLARRLDQVL